MKKPSFIILSCLMIGCRAMTTTQQSDKKVDSFIREQINIAQSKEKSNPLEETQIDTTFTFEKCINLLERITDIRAERQQTYLAVKIVDATIINKWSDWINKNRTLLIWENDKNRINRKDKDIYSGLLIPHFLR